MTHWGNPSLIFLLLFALAGCSSSKEKYEFDKRDTSQYHQNLQIVQYFLPDIPSWANFSQSASCKRKTFIRFFNLRKLRQSFALSYEEAIQFQYMFNQELIAIKDEIKSSYLLFRDEERIFYNVTDKINAHIKAFKRPQYQRVHLVWVDPLRMAADKVKMLMESEEMGKGHPVFVSLCLSHYELRKFLLDSKLGGMNIRTIPFEMFTVYNDKNEIQHNYQLDFPKVFDDKQELHFFLPKGIDVPIEFKGQFKLHYY